MFCTAGVTMGKLEANETHPIKHPSVLFIHSNHSYPG
jgi:hypothetical protein